VRRLILAAIAIVTLAGLGGWVQSNTSGEEGWLDVAGLFAALAIHFGAIPLIGVYALAVVLGRCGVRTSLRPRAAPISREELPATPDRGAVSVFAVQRLTRRGW
jgi:hypothetical protein